MDGHIFKAMTQTIQICIREPQRDYGVHGAWFSAMRFAGGEGSKLEVTYIYYLLYCVQNATENEIMFHQRWRAKHAICNVPEIEEKYP